MNAIIQPIQPIGSCLILLHTGALIQQLPHKFMSYICFCIMYYIFLLGT